MTPVSPSPPTPAGSRNRTPARTLLVGCGALGTRLGRRLTDDGGHVFALRRTTNGLPDDFTALPVDLYRPVPVSLPAVDAMVITLPPSGPVRGAADGTDPGHDGGYLTALRHLAEALPHLPPRVILVSSTRVFEGHTHGRALTERDAPAPLGPRATTLLEGERLARELFKAHILRPAGIYGPGRELLLRRVLEAAPVQYARRTNRIYETDLVRTLHALVTAAQPPRLLHAVDQSPASLGDVVSFIAHRLGVAPPPAVEPAEVSGRVFDGAALLEFLGELEHPSFESGYGDLITTREEGT